MSGGERYRLGIATRGFRGGSGSNIFINESVELANISTVTDIIINRPSVDIDFGEINVGVVSDTFTVTLSSIPEIEVTTGSIESIEVTVEDC